MLNGRIIRLATAMLGVAALAVSVQPSANAVRAQDDVPTFQEFRAATFRDVGGQYVVNTVGGDAASLMDSGSWSPGDIMAHQLGHTLGFRHEHTRPEAGTCFEDDNWRPLTPYDSASIMHYPQRNGSSSDLSMTETDRAGVRSVYGS